MRSRNLRVNKNTQSQTAENCLVTILKYIMAIKDVTAFISEKILKGFQVTNSCTAYLRSAVLNKEKSSYLIMHIYFSYGLQSTDLKQSTFSRMRHRTRT